MIINYKILLKLLIASGKNLAMYTAPSRTWRRVVYCSMKRALPFFGTFEPAITNK